MAAKNARRAARNAAKAAEKAAQAALPREKPAVERPSPPPTALLDLGVPPEDPLGANSWAHRVVIMSMLDAARDPDLSPRERRKEIRVLSASAAKLMPDARRWESEQLIKASRAELERKESDKRGAALEPRPPRPPRPVEPVDDGPGP